VGLLFIGFLPLFIVGWAGLIKKQRAIAIWTLCLWLASILPSAIPMEVPHALRSMDAIVIFPIVISFGVYSMIKNQFRWVLSPILLVALLEAGLFAHDYLVHYPARSASSWQYGYEQLATNLYNRTSEYDRVIVDYPDWRLYLSMLFFQKIDPQTLLIQTDFIYKQFGAYSFSEIKKLSSDVRTLMVLSPERYASLKPSVYEILYDYEGKPEFYLVKGGQ
jgi:hypothetical protein